MPTDRWKWPWFSAAKPSLYSWLAQARGCTLDAQLYASRGGAAAVQVDSKRPPASPAPAPAPPNPIPASAGGCCAVRRRPSAGNARHTSKATYLVLGIAAVSRPSPTPFAAGGCLLLLWTPSGTPRGPCSTPWRQQRQVSDIPRYGSLVHGSSIPTHRDVNLIPRSRRKLCNGIELVDHSLSRRVPAMPRYDHSCSSPACRVQHDLEVGDARRRRVHQ